MLVHGGRDCGDCLVTVKEEILSGCGGGGGGRTSASAASVANNGS